MKNQREVQPEVQVGPLHNGALPNLDLDAVEISTDRHGGLTSSATGGSYPAQSDIPYVAFEIATDATESLRAGKIPVELAESLKLVHAESKEKTEVENILYAISTKLVKAIPDTQFARREFSDFDEVHQAATYHISADEDPNALVLKYTKPGIVVVSKGLVDAEKGLKSIDALAFVIAHELAHKAIEAKYGAGRGSKGEEGLADLLAIEIMHHAGYDARSSLEILSLGERAKTSEQRFNEMIDVHPSFTTRLGLLEAALTKLEKEVGELNVTPTSLSDTTLAESVKALTFTELRPPSDFEQALHKKFDYDELESNFDKLCQIQQAFAYANFDDARTLRDIQKRLRKISVAAEDADSQSIVDQLADNCLLKVEADPNLTSNESRAAYYVYSALSICCAEVPPKVKNVTRTRPLGRLKYLAKHIQDFISVDGKENTFSAARTILDEFDREPLKGTKIFEEIEWPEFRFRPKAGATVAFQRHYEAAKRMAPERRAVVTKALLAIGIEDARLIHDLNLRDYLDTLEGKSIHLKKVSKKGYFVRDAELTGSGAIGEIGKPGSAVSVRCSMERFARIPQLIEKVFADIDPHNPSERDVALLKEAAARYGDFQRDNIESRHTIDTTPDYTIGLSYLEKNPALFCHLNIDAISRSADLQVKVIDKLSSLIESQHPNAREVVRTVLSVNDHFGLNPFVFPPPGEGTKLTIEQQDKQILAMPLAKWMLALPTDFVSGPEKVQLLFSQVLETYEVGALLCSETRGRRAMQFLAMDFPEFSRLATSYEDIFSRYKKFDDIDLGTINERTLPALLEMEFRIRAQAKAPTAQQLSQLIAKVGASSVKADAILIETVLKHYETRAPQWSENPGAAIIEWQNLHEAGAMPPGRAYQQLNKIISEFKSSATSEERIDTFEKLLSGQRIADPKVRERTINLWSSDIEKTLGKDNGSSDFHQKLEQLVSRLNSVEPVLRMEMLDAVGKRLRTQREGTRILETGLPVLSRDRLEQSQVIGICAESSLSLLRKEPDVRKIILQFITGPLSQSTALSFVEKMSTESAFESDQGRFGKLSEVSGEDFEARKNKQKRVEAVTLFHRNFWSAPFEVRAVIAREMLLPPDNTTAEDAAEMFDLALDITFPKKLQYSNKAKDFVRAYIDCVPEYSKHIAISALMVAAERSRGRNASVGFALASFLESMGPAEVKAGQAAESHPSVPTAIREDLARLKTNADEPTRWALWNLLDDCVPEETRAQIETVNQVLGSASFYVVASVTMRNGEDKVVALLRPNALSRAENGFRLMSEMAEALGDQHPAFNTLLELIDQATELATIESNPIISKDQIEQARSLYNGSTVEVDGYKFELAVPAVSEVGERYRLMDQASGKHFLDIPDKEKTIEKKRAIAKAIAAFELSLIVRGLPFDDDRHGGNCKIDRNRISHFDFGGMMLDPPSDTDLRKFGEVMVNVLSRISKAGDFADEYFQEIKKLKETEGSVPALVKRVQKALLSIGDYRRYFQGDDLVDVLATAIQSAHPTLRSVALAKVMSLGGPSTLPDGFMAKLMNPPIQISWGNE